MIPLCETNPQPAAPGITVLGTDFFFCAPQHHATSLPFTTVLKTEEMFQLTMLVYNICSMDTSLTLTVPSDL